MSTSNQQFLRPQNTGIIITILIIIAVIIVLVSSISIVGAGERVVVFDKFRGVLEETRGEGMTIIIPFIQDAIHYDVKSQTYTMSSKPSEGEVRGDDAITALTSDGQIVTLDMSVRYHPDPDMVWRLHKTLGPDYVRKVIRPEVKSVTREVISAYRVMDVYSKKREEIQLQMEKKLEKSFKKSDVVMDGVLIRNIVFSEEFQKAIEAKQVALQEAQRMQYILEKEEREKKRKIIEAQGEAEAIRLKGQALSQNPKLIQFEYVKKLSPEIKAIITDQNSILNFSDFLKENPSQ